MAKVKLVFCLLVIVSFAFATASSAQVAGKIAGYVKDANTGDPLPGANVMIKGTSLGAATDTDGYYYMINVQPGIYTVSCSMMGYKTLTKTNVQVVVGQTTKLDFILEETVLEVGEEVVVTAERPLIEADVTSKVSTVTYDEIKNMPAEDMTRVLALQSNITILTNTPYAKSGYNIRGIEDIRMRGGRNNEVGLFIDGMKVQNPLFGGFATRINNNAINQMTVAAGGFSPEYGNALSGVINLTTREGGNRFSGLLEYGTSMPFGVEALATDEGRARNYQDVQISLNGPVPFVRNLSFFFSGEVSTQAGTVYEFDDIIWNDHPLVKNGTLPTSNVLFQDFIEDGKMDSITLKEVHSTIVKDVYGADRWINPLDTWKGWHGMGWRNSFDWLGKLTYRLSPTMKLSVSASQYNAFSRINNFHAGYYYHLPGEWYNIDVNPVDDRENIDRLLVCNECGSRIELRGDRFDKNGNLVSAHVPTPDACPVCGSTDFEIWHRNRSGMAARQVQIRASNRFHVIWNHTISPSTFYTVRFQRFFESRHVRVLRDPTKPYGSIFGLKNYFAPDWENILRKEQYAHYNTYGVRDPWEGYFRMRYDNHYFSGDSSYTYDIRFDFTSQINKHHQLKFGLQYTKIHQFRHDDQGTRGPTAYPTIYNYWPEEGAFYIMDKIEYASVVINVGGRLDYAFPDTVAMWEDPLDPLDEQDFTRPGLEYRPFKKGKRKWKISPRIGIAYPITSTSVIHFNFGHFYQQPNYRDLYRASGAIREVSMQLGNIIGNPLLEPEKSIQYEIGYQHQIGNLWGINITLWSKETTNQVGSITVPAYSDPQHQNPYTYSVFVNNNFGSARGIDLAIRKRYSHYFSGTINYTWSQARVLRPTSWDGYWNDDTQKTIPKRETKPRWDQPHNIRVYVNFSIPRNAGPTIFGKKLLSSTGLSIFYQGESGRPYTPTFDETGYVAKENSARWPFFHQVDLRAYRNFKLFGLTYSAFLQVRNLFDRKNVMDGYTNTGSATDPGGLYSEYSATRMDGISINNFGPRRSVTFGLRITF